MERLLQSWELMGARRKFELACFEVKTYCDEEGELETKILEIRLLPYLAVNLY